MPKRENLRTWLLQKEVTLTVSYKRKLPHLGVLEDFLRQAMMHFKKRQRDQQTSDVHSEFFEDRVVYGRDVYANCRLVHAPETPGSYLSADDWVKVIVAAYSALTTIGDIHERLDVHRRNATGWLKNVVIALEQQNDFDAFEVVLNHMRSSDLHRV